ncbi:MAG TPA: hypothetical protein VF410_11090, partial [Rhizomicrobium sp.]
MGYASNGASAGKLAPDSKFLFCGENALCSNRISGRKTGVHFPWNALERSRDVFDAEALDGVAGADVFV